MKLVLLLVSLAAAAPQLPADVDPEIVADIFGNSGFGGGYGGGGGSAAINDDGTSSNGNQIDVVVNVVQESQPADYAPAEPSDPVDKATVEANAQFETCAEYTEQYGYMCVPYYQCHNGTIITDGAGLIDIRNGFGSLNPEDSKCEGFLDVCCKDPDFIPPPPPKIIYKPRCGRRNLNGIGARIQGFTEGESQFGEWPHMCAVLHDKTLDKGESANLYKCGGSLIAPGVILTAAHCVADFKPIPEQIKVRCGEWDTQQQSEPYPHQDRKGASVKVHPEFNPKNLANDFALIFVDTEFDLDFHVDTVCLPQPNQDFEYQQCFATGWGKDRFGSEGDYQVVLKEIDLGVVNNVECQDKLRQTRLGKKFKLDSSFMCAGGQPGKDTCKGDGGSPLVCPNANDPTRYEQAGIVAWGIGCGEDGTPGVYASVAKAACWIDYVMTCYYGAVSGQYASFMNYEDAQCGTWMQEKLQDLDRKAEAGGARLGKIFEAIKREYTTCTVNWLTAGDGGYVENLEVDDVDLGDFGRDGANSYAEGAGAGVGEAVKINDDSYSADQAPKAAAPEANGSY
eukprot:TRINITY_DN1053_c0_g2_i4.p1 TRINITY_DN1053_c0_g2~~TRINITY_DN1053_c0_g2_i4.p1  ORF type:complete len:566 (-),score=227.91 TRINITY_DN1053_c0_g2_i4:210-1907(-)